MSKPSKAELDKAVLQGSKEFAVGEFEQAAESFSHACEIYSRLHHGKDSPSILLLYGRALYNNALKNADVFGGAGKKDEDEAEDDEEKKEDEDEKNGFQFEEDQALEDNKDSEAQDNTLDEGAAEEAGHGNDLEMAWEVLDTSRTLYNEKIESLNSDLKKKIDSYNESKAAAASDPDFNEAERTLEIEALKEKMIDLKKGLADVYNVLGDISLENEEFAQAALDFKSDVDLTSTLYPENSSRNSEARFKLVLAYQLCDNINIEPSEVFQDNDANKDKTFNDLAIKEMQHVIEMVRAQVERKEIEDPNILEDMEEKLKELEAAAAEDKERRERIEKEAVQGLTGASSSSSATDSKTNSTLLPNTQEFFNKKLTSLAKQVQTANDLSSMVRKGNKDKKKGTAPVKRSLDNDEKDDEPVEKKPKTDS